MSNRSMWKMLHALYTLQPGQKGLSDAALVNIGIDCGPDTLEPLVRGDAVLYDSGLYALSRAGQTILGACVVANRRWSADDMWVDYPSAFVIMPFGEPWSAVVYDNLIKPGVENAGLACVRGDAILRIGDLAQNIWGALLHAGMAIADVSALNPNVFYELGLVHALGKDTIILKQAGSKLPADFGGAHYHEYDLQDLGAGKAWLTAELSKWSKDARSQAVKSLRGG